MKVIMKNGEVKDCSFEEELGRQAFWHTTAHILAQAVKRLYPSAKCAAGPAVKEGFFYDFDFDFEFTGEHLKKVQEMMQVIVKESLSLTRRAVSRQEAAALFTAEHEPYKAELLAAILPEEEITLYRQGEYTEMCAGPHIANTNLVKAIWLTGTAGAYWKGDERNPMLTRIYGISFPKPVQLEEYRRRQEELKKRDHRKLGKELELFTIFEQGPGFPVFLPKGMILKNLLLDFWRDIHRKEGYQEIQTPVLLRRSLWETSGHWEHYRDSMYTLQIDEEDYAVKPMSCPGGMLVYQSRPRSYRELPLRLAELGLVHRNEKSGTLHGLMRVRSFTQDDAHIFMKEDQIIEEIQRVARLIDRMYGVFGFAYTVELSTRPENSIGSDEEWELATDALRNAMEAMQIPYAVNEGDGAFYGPKLDFHLRDSMGRTWQCGTIQLDFQLPQRFDARYTGEDGRQHRPIMIHRVVFGSIERFIGILIEHYAGRFPLWLAPVQARVLPVSEQYAAYGRCVAEKLSQNGLRCEMGDCSEKLGYRIREAQLERIPYLVIVGKKEEALGMITVRDCESTENRLCSPEEFETLCTSQKPQI